MSKRNKLHGILVYEQSDDDRSYTFEVRGDDLQKGVELALEGLRELLYNEYGGYAIENMTFYQTSNKTRVEMASFNFPPVE